MLSSDERTDRVLTAMAELSDVERLEALVGNLADLAEQMAAVGPEMPTLTRELITTLREAVVVLQALQRTWLLESKSKAVRRERNDESK